MLFKLSQNDFIYIAKCVPKYNFLILGEKPHVCETCNKGFSTSSSLNTHRRIHLGLKPHICGQCGKCFTASSNLYYHKMTHTKVNDIVFVC